MKTLECLITLGLTTLLVACNSPRDASEENFTKAINDELADKCIKVDPDGRHFLRRKDQYPVTMPTNAVHVERFDALVDVGVLKSSATTTVNPSRRRTIISGSRKVPNKRYELTEEGKAALWSPEFLIFCAGHYEVKSIKDFTLPNDGADAKVSKVRITYEAVDVPDWARSQPVLEFYPELKKKLIGEREARVRLHLTNNGWKAVRSPFDGRVLR